MMPRSAVTLAGLLALATLACGGEPHDPELVTAAPSRVEGTALELRDTVVQAAFTAPGTARPFREAMLSTRLMGTVREVLVEEGSRVASGAVLVRLDAAELDAKGAQVAAQIEGAEAMLREAERQATRIRSLYADSAATRAQLDAAETGLAGARAALDAARAGERELAAVRAYATVVAPFDGMVSSRMVDPGAMAAPGAPLLTIQDAGRLRIPVDVPTGIATGVRQGDRLAVRIGTATTSGTVEGVVPGAGGNVATINVIVPNPAFAILPGTPATVSIPGAGRPALLVPEAAVIRRGDLTGVQVRTADGDRLRWIRLGATHGGLVEVAGGLGAGATIVVPADVAGGR